MFSLDAEERAFTAAVLQIPQHVSHFIVSCSHSLSPPNDSLLCFPYSQIVSILSESPPTPRAQKCTSWGFVPALKSGECLCFKT